MYAPVCPIALDKEYTGNPIEIPIRVSSEKIFNHAGVAGPTVIMALWPTNPVI